MSKIIKPLAYNFSIIISSECMTLALLPIHSRLLSVVPSLIILSNPGHSCCPFGDCEISSVRHSMIVLHPQEPRGASGCNWMSPFWPSFITFSNICVCEYSDGNTLCLWDFTVSEELYCFRGPAPYSLSPQGSLPGHEDGADLTILIV